MVDLWPDLFRPPLGVVTTVLILLGASGAAVAMYLHDRGGAAPMRRMLLLTLRMAGIVGLAWLLAGPSRRVPGGLRGDRPRVVLLADTSQSMAERDVRLGDQTVSRWEAIARSWLSDTMLAVLNDRADVEVWGFDETSNRRRPEAASDIDPAGRGTLMYEALERTAATPRSGASVAVVLSDGHDTQRGSDPRAAARLRERGWRVFAVPVGSRSDHPDLALHAWAETDRLLDGQTTRLHAQVIHQGFAGRTVAVDLRHEGALIDTRIIDALGEGPARVSFEINPRAAPGEPWTQHRYEATVRPLEARDNPERLTENNRRWVFLDVTRQRLRVALFEGEPYWDTRYLARHLRQDPQVDLVTHLQLSPQRQIVQRGDTEIDVAADNLDSYDIVMLGRGVEAFFPGESARRLVEYVESGGALVLVRGQPFTDDPEAMQRLDPVLPVTWGERVVGRLRAAVTEAGASVSLWGDDPIRAGVSVSRLPDLIAATLVEDRRAASVVVLEQTPRDAGADAPPMAAVVYQRTGEGRVLAVLSDGLWQWAFVPGTLAEHESVYAMFWSRAVRWLAAEGEFLPGQDWALQLDRLSSEPGQTVGVTAASRYPVATDITPTLVWRDPDGHVQPIPLHRSAPGSLSFRGTITPRATGIHELSLQWAGVAEGKPSAPPTVTRRLAVSDSSIELIDTSARPDVLMALARDTGGACLDLNDPRPVLDALDDATAAATVDDRFEYAIGHAGVLSWIAAAFGVEWWLRRRGGLA